MGDGPPVRALFPRKPWQSVPSALYPHYARRNRDRGTLVSASLDRPTPPDGRTLLALLWLRVVDRPQR